MVATGAPTEPTRAGALYTATVISSVGRGAYYTVAAIFYHTMIGLSPFQIGLGMAAAGAAGIVGAYLSGHGCERVGYRTIYIMATGALGVSYLGAAFVGSFAGFLATALAIGVFKYAGNTACIALIGSEYSTDHRLRIQATTRAVTNVGIALGGIAAGGALLGGTRLCFQSVLVGVGIATLLSAGPLFRLPQSRGPRVPATPAAPRVTAPGARSPFRNMAYCVIAFSGGVYALYFAATEVGVPLWADGYTSSPHVVVSALLVVNTAIVIVAQVPIASRVSTISAGRKWAMRSALVLAAACVVMGLTGLLTAPTATVITLVIGVALLSIGEVAGEATVWALSMAMAEQDQMARYQSVVQMFQAVGQCVGPLVFSVTALAFGPSGWLALGALFLGAGCVMAVAARENTAGGHVTRNAAANIASVP